ncbi:hypothetical protein ID866_5189 [Astraeus odoratus]|nr:hypothetical protein ID866_5189 [Astraeus odoratus]
MSFQHFRLGQLAMSQPLPPHLQQNTPGQSFSQNIQAPATNAPASAVPPTSTQTVIVAAPSVTKPSSNRPPYGSGDSDDGYTLVFPNITAFQEWRTREEETQMVEFVKGDTHGSKAVPPRFKDHTKLVCARHSRSGRKKYVKKHPERVRKVPSRKVSTSLGVSHASISFKTYYDTEEVRVCCQYPISNGNSLLNITHPPHADVSEHSHAIGLANLPFTRRGRRAAVEAEKTKSKRHGQVVPPSATEASSSTNAPASTPASTSSAPAPQQPPMPGFPAAAPLSNLPHPFTHYPPPPGVAPAYPPPPSMVPAAPHGPSVQQEFWDRMSVLFNSVREHARTYEYPGASVVALESVLLRLYLESPVAIVGGSVGLAPGMHQIPRQQSQAQQSHQESHSQAPANGPSGTGEQGNTEMDRSMESG